LADVIEAESVAHAVGPVGFAKISGEILVEGGKHRPMVTSWSGGGFIQNTGKRLA
jgi:hypothetical protein